MKPLLNDNDIITLFQKEFSSILEKFEIYNLNIFEAKQSKADHIWKPGCYVYWSPNKGPIKVGRSLSNSRKRALEHIRDNTGGIMKSLEDESDAKLLLFNVKDEKNNHWVAAVEIFMELKLKPWIPSKRLG